MAIRSEYTRVIHPNDYDIEKGRFKSISFKPSSDGTGISIFCTQCGVKESGSICGHIARFYSTLTGEPPIYWEIPSDDIPQHCGFTQVPSSSGDDCHLEIDGWIEKESGKYIKKLPIEKCMICDPSGTRPLKKEDLEK